MSTAHKQIFVFIGPPGSGKGSLAQLCSKELGWAQLSTGDLCRQHIVDKTEIGKQIDFFIRSGKLIPDSLMIGMVEEWLLKSFSDLDVLILDGFPRTVVQAEALDELLRKEIFSNVSLCVVQLKIDDTIVIDRMTSRLICPNKTCGKVYSKNHAELMPHFDMECDRCPGVSLVVRSDDTIDSIKHRLTIYHKHAQGLLNYYHNHGKNAFIALDANKPLHKVFIDLLHIIGLELKK